jgi:hypothetical protein
MVDLADAGRRVGMMGAISLSELKPYAFLFDRVYMLYHFDSSDADGYRWIDDQYEELEALGFLRLIDADKVTLGEKQLGRVSKFARGSPWRAMAAMEVESLNSVTPNIVRQEGIEPVAFLAYQWADSRTVKRHADASHVCDLIIRQFPTVDEETPWEKIIELQKDAEMRSRRIKLQKWMRSMVSSDRPIEEVREELADLLYDYESYMHLQHKKVNKGILQTLISAAGGVFEHFPLLNFAKLTDLPFVLRQRKFDLADAESKAPGREIAYISQVQKRLKR